MTHFFSLDGAFMRFLTKTGQIIQVNLLWIVCCIPVITIIPATGAMYYTMVKVVRKERSYIRREFFSAFRRMLKQGVIFTLGTAALIIILYLDREAAAHKETTAGVAGVILYDLLFVLLAAILAFLIPNLSRFNLKFGRLLKMTCFMCLKHLPVTAALVAGTFACGWLILVLPMAVVFILPGAWCMASSYLLEPVLKQYTPKPEPGVDAWYYE